MRVKLCRRCPYTPRDLADHYDPEAALHVCAKCDGEQAMLTNHYPREVHRRRKCATVHNIFEMAQRCGAPSVQGSAQIASRPARWVIADGYSDFAPPDNQLQSE